VPGKGGEKPQHLCGGEKKNKEKRESSSKKGPSNVRKKKDCENSPWRKGISLEKLA